VQLDPTPLLASSDPDYRALYEAVLERTGRYAAEMYSAD
jgi:hypothetical protein